METINMLSVILQTLVMLGQALAIAAVIYGIYLAINASSYASSDVEAKSQIKVSESDDSADNVTTLTPGHNSAKSVSYRRVA
ncbi:MAG TPA: hypothetical protein VI543_02495 [Sulfuricaulis sp.]|nr:hypothetical protein [Sulfuricaulis sp.]